MSCLYSVTLRRMREITTIHGEGKKATTSTRLEWIEETYRDLPYATAQRYAALYPDAVIERQHQEWTPSKSRAQVKVRSDHHKPQPKKSAGRKPAPLVRDDGYADVINEMAGEGA